MNNSFSTQDSLDVNGQPYRFHSLARLGARFDLTTLPYSLKILLENLLRHEDGSNVNAGHIEALANWDASREPDTEIAFMPSRVVLQDFTGVPCVVDLAAMRDAVARLGGDPKRINPLIPSELVIDHSVQVDVFGRPDALDLNGEIEFERNRERYAFLRWGQKALTDFRVVPPNTGIVHQVNLEHLARVVMTREIDGTTWAFPDTVFGTDSHTTMINGIGVLGWGVGGIEAEAAMLGQPSSMLIPQVVGFRLSGRLPEGTTATDLVLTVTQMLRKLGVVGKFVEFYGDGLQHLPLADRATIANMAPEYGATCGIFPIDAEALNYLRLSGRSAAQIALVEAYAKAQGLWHTPDSAHARYSQTLHLDLGDVRPSLAGPKRPQDRVLLDDMPSNVRDNLKTLSAGRGNGAGAAMDAEGASQAHAEHLAAGPVSRIRIHDRDADLRDGSVVIAAITSCTNTSNPAVMLAAGLLARNARACGLTVKPWVKTSLAPGSLVVTDYLRKAGLLDDLEALGFYVVGYGCTTCIGNSGPLPDAVSRGIAENDLVVASVLSGNRNFEGRVHPEVKMNYLASPPLVVAYALAGSVAQDLVGEPLGQDPAGQPVYLRDIWPSNREIGDLIASSIGPEMFAASYADVFKGDSRWNRIAAPDGESYAWDAASTYIKHPPYFDGMQMAIGPIRDITGARVLGLFGDSITTDHISPAGNIKKDSPAGRYLLERGVQPADFNSYGSRRGNDDVMVRGTFANIRIKNRMLGGEEGGNTLYFGRDGATTKLAIYDAAMRYQADAVPLVVVAGKEYGTGSSRDWAAKGTLLLGVKAVLAESFERIHRANLVGMGVLPLQFLDGETAETHHLDGSEVISVTGLEDGAAKRATVTARRTDGSTHAFQARVLLLTPKEVEYFRHGGILHYVLRQLAAR